jgi:uncharacterized DUF497 family protein
MLGRDGTLRRAHAVTAAGTLRKDRISRDKIEPPRGVISQHTIRHGIALQDAARIFDGPTVERVDDRFDYGEVRIYAIGLVNGIEITVIYTDRDPDERHLISAWRAEPHERRYFWQRLED